MNTIVRKLFIGDLSWKRAIRSLILIPIFVYLGLFALAWFFPNRLLFRPQKTLYTDDGSVIKLTTSDGEIISAKFYENRSAFFTILFSHGNAEDIGNIDTFAAQLRDAGFSVLTYDYHGFGTSQGVPTEENTYRDVDAAYRFLVNFKKFPAERIILHGRSLGGGAAIDLASRQPVAGLIAESTFTSAARVLTGIPIFPFDRFENINKIGNVHCPVLVIHGKEDATIPFKHGQILYKTANEPKRFFGVDAAGHNNLFRVAGSSYLTALNDFAASLPKEKGFQQP